MELIAGVTGSEKLSVITFWGSLDRVIVVCFRHFCYWFEYIPTVLHDLCCYAFQNQLHVSFTQTEVTMCLYMELSSVQERSWGKIIFYSSNKWSFELASVPSMPWQKECSGAVALGGWGKRSWLLYSTSISPVINCLRKDRLNNYGCALHSSTPMLYSQTVLEQNKAASVSVTDSCWDLILRWRWCQFW